MQIIINGQMVDSFSGEITEVVSPVTGETIDTVPKAGKEDILTAIAAAKENQQAWAKIPLYKRASILTGFVDLLKAKKEYFARLLCAENGKPLTEARTEISNTTLAFTAFIEASKHFYGTIIPPGTEPGQAYNMQLVTRHPLGIVACILPFNFPCDMFYHKVAPALLMGNSAIIFPSSDSCLTILKLTALLVEAGVPAGVIQCITAPGASKSTVVNHPDISLVTLTGSTDVGIKTAQAAAANLTHVTLELGGNDPFILLADGDVDEAAAAAVLGRMYNAGQICCASKRFIIHSSLKRDFEKKVISRLEKIERRNPISEDCRFGYLINEKAARKVEQQIARTLDQGGRLLMGGKRDGAFFYPTLITDIPPTAAVAKDMEIFGPVISIIEFDTEEEALALANASSFGLSGCVFSKDTRSAFRVADALETGTVVINGSGFFRSIEQPFGGWKQSGIGTEGVMSTFQEMTRVKTTVLKGLK